MKVVHVLRKPCSEPTVAANVLRHGTGALNIDATRIGTNAGWAYPNGRGGSGWHGRESLGNNLTQPMASTSGRWPANLVLQHLPTCEQTGTRKVKASGFDRSKPPRSSGIVYGKHKDTPQVRHSDPDGTETVAAWACAPGCPVAALDAQSGELHHQNPATRKGRAGKHGTGEGTTYLATKDTGNHYGDTGGASRFFKQVKP